MLRPVYEKQQRPNLVDWGRNADSNALSFAALAIAVFMKLVFAIATIKAVVLFLGLQGTIFLASALSPPHEEMKLARPKGLLKRLRYEITEGL